jgi:serine/threonine-protein kinase
MTGTKLAHYHIKSRLGSGGMGDVYEATDAKLGRSVAIKFLPDAFLHDSERVARFQREARVLASLNHPNIAGIYGVEESDGRTFLVMELVSGETLAARIARGSVAADEAIGIGIQIADALAAAHEKGITHRDLKPANIMLTASGAVKVLDFGLAKVTDGGPGYSADSPTLTIGSTQDGVILGTAAYMSPEQARGKTVDKRADVWAFAVVLYELLTGKRLFSSEDISETLAKVIRDEPNLDVVPVEIRPLLRRCLEKDPRKRQRDIGDVKNELEHALSTRSTALRVAAAPTAQRTLRVQNVAIAVLLLLAAALAGIGIWRGRFSSNTADSSGVVRVSVTIPPSIRTAPAGWPPARQTIFTRDGSGLIMLGHPRKPDDEYDSRGRIYTRRFSDYEFKPIPQTEGATMFVLDPAGEWIAYVAPVSEQALSEQRLMKVRVDGSSPPVLIAPWDSSWGSLYWLEDGDLLVMADHGTKYFRLQVASGQAKTPIRVDTGGAPVVGAAFAGRLPGDRGIFLFLATGGSRGYEQDIWVLDPKTGKAHIVTDHAESPTYLPSGHLVFSRGETLAVAPFDLDRLALSGAITPLSGGLRTLSYSSGSFEIAASGHLMYAPGGQVGADRRVIIADSKGNVTAAISERKEFSLTPRVSSDGTKVLLTIPSARSSDWETWLAELERRELRPLCSVPAGGCSGRLWSPHGERFAYSGDGDHAVYIRTTDGSGMPQPVIKVEPPVILAPLSWAPDDSGIIVSRRENGRLHLLFVPFAKNGEAGPTRNLLGTPYDESGARFSPDGQLVAFGSDETGSNKVYVASYGADGKVGSPVPVSISDPGPPEGDSDGSPTAFRLAWADSRRLFFTSSTEKVMSVTIETKPELKASTPALAYDLKKLRVNLSQWDILPDGSLLAIQRGEQEDDIREFNVVLNWMTEFRERMGKAGK